MDCRAAAEERGGRGTVVRELLRAWRRSDSDHEFALYARSAWELSVDERFEWRLCGSRDPLWHARVAAAANRDCDVYLSTNSYLTALRLRVPTAVMVMDLVAWRPASRPQRRAAVIERLTLPPATRRARAFQCISHATAADLVERFPRVAGRVRVIHLAAAEWFTAAGPRADLEGRPYVLGVGTLEPRKNLPRLIEAFAGLAPEIRGNRLLALVGAVGWESSETMAAMRRHAPLVRPLGHLPDEELAAFYRGADLFAYPSLYEGFGLPVLEAMSCGAPVVTSSVSSLPEVAGDAAVYVDPSDTGSVRRGISAALQSEQLRADLVRRGLERAAGFSWNRAAAETLDLLTTLGRPRSATG